MNDPQTFTAPVDSTDGDLNADNREQLLLGLRHMRLLNIWFVRVFFAVLFLTFVFSLYLPWRPQYSETEKRKLAEFPRFSLAALASGDYFEGIGEWYADTFPFRERLIGLNARLSAFAGKTDVQIHGTVEKGDDIPEISAPASTGSGESEAPSEATEQASSDSSPSEPEIPVKDETASPETPPAPSTPPTPPAPTTQTLGALLINGDTAYEYYNFVQSTAASYANAVNRAAALLEGKATVYDMIVPTSMGITAPEALLAGVNTSDQRKAIEYMFSLMQPSVRKIPLYDALKAHREEYIYFRTDHHWTALGAYYAYVELMRNKGVAPTVPDSYIIREFPGYLGSFYSASGKLPQLAANPDTVVAYQPPQTNAIRIQGQNGAWTDYEIISDKSTVSAKYMTFIRGDNPYSVITNPELNDGSACIVVKESFGNSLVPFLVAHYQTVHIVDYRYFSAVDPRGLCQLRDETGASDVIFINNVSATRNKALVGSIDALIR